MLLQCCKTKYLEKQVKQIGRSPPPSPTCWLSRERQYPTYETNLSIRAEMQNLAVLSNDPKPATISELLADLDHWVGRLTPGSYGSHDLLFWLVAKLPRDCGTSAGLRQSARREPSTTRICLCYSWSWHRRKKATST